MSNSNQKRDIRKKVVVGPIDKWLPSRLTPKGVKRRVKVESNIKTLRFVHLPVELWCKYIIPKVGYRTLIALNSVCTTLRDIIVSEHAFFQLKPPYFLYPYQADTIQWMRSIEVESHLNKTTCHGGILSLAMGLGKTLVTYMHCLTEKKYKTSPSLHPSLIIASKQILWEWQNTLDKFFNPDQLKVLFLHPSVNKVLTSKNITYDIICQYDMVITTYDIISDAFRNNNIVDRVGKRTSNGKIYGVEKIKPDTHKDHTVVGSKLFFDMTWKRVIADESDKFSNPRSCIYDAMLSLQGFTNWCLTGTPIRNKQSDLWSLFKFCGVPDTPNKKKFDVIQHVANTELKFHLWQKTKEQAGIKLPPKISETLIIPWEKDIDSLPWKCYLTYESSTRRMFNEEQLGNIPFTYVLALFTRMRQICDAPYLVSTDLHEEGDDTLGVDNDRMVLSGVSDELKIWLKQMDGTAGYQSPKMKALWNIVKSIPLDEKTTIFTSFVGASKLITQMLEQRGMGVVRMDGSLTNTRRLDALRNIRTDDKTRFIVMTFQVGGTGLTLTECNNVILFDLWWCPAVLRQAEDRVHRLGQTKQVRCWTLAMENSIEERMLNIDCKQKEQMISTLQTVIHDSWTGNSNTFSIATDALKKGLDADTMYSLICE